METYTIDLEAMGKRIKALRQSLKKTQGAFADMIHISTSYLALIEQGKRTASLDVVAEIAKSCCVSVDFLLFGTPEAPSSQNQKTFDSLSRKYSEAEIERALKLTAFYLRLGESSK